MFWILLTGVSLFFFFFKLSACPRPEMAIDFRKISPVFSLVVVKDQAVEVMDNSKYLESTSDNKFRCDSQIPSAKKVL